MTRLQFKQLRGYQSKINIKVAQFLHSVHYRGQVYAPTGSGKTVCFSHTINDLPTIIKQMRGSDHKLNIGIVHPRIALSQDQLSRFKKTFGSKFHYTSFHSGRHIAGDEQIREINTLDPDELERIIELSDRHHITFSSYDSLHKIAHINFDLLICDESHNLVQEQYRTTLASLAAKKILFYTATPINMIVEDEEDENHGMANSELFGEVIVEVLPLELITPGYVLGPMVHRMIAHTDQRGDGADTTALVAAAYNHQQKEMKRYRMPYIQMLVASRGYGDHNTIEENLLQLWELIGEQVDVYVIEAADARCNGVSLSSRFDALEQIKASNRPAIVLHYDTLAEGIDIDTLTGALILRRLSKSKLLQTIGRCGRPYNGDLDDLGEVKDMSSRKKPHSIITLPVVDGVHIGGMDAQHIADAFIDGGYGELSTWVEMGDEVRAVPGTRPDNPFDDEEENDPFLSKVEDVRVVRQADRLIELGFTF